MTKRGEQTSSGASWQAAHARLVSLARERAGLDFEEGRCLLTARRAEVHRALGYGSFTEYVERILGYAARVTHDKLRVAAALERLPELSRQLAQGMVSYSQARELTRVATPETEQIWLESARGRTVREVEKLVAGRAPGSVPDSPAAPELQRHLLRFEVSGETLASFREAVAPLRHEAGEYLDDDALLLLLARRVLGGPVDDGRASYQIALDVCEQCRRTRQVADGETIALSPAATEMACCDAQHIPSAHVGTSDGGSRAAQEVPPAARRAVLRRDRHRCQAPGCKHATWVDVHHLETRADGGDHDPSNLLTLCGAHHRAVHEGTLLITGSVGAALAFWHADGTAYGAIPSAPVSLVQARAFRALRELGFGERDVRQALSAALPHHAHAANDAELEPVLRRCLGLLTASALSHA